VARVDEEGCGGDDSLGGVVAMLMTVLAGARMGMGLLLAALAEDEAGFLVLLEETRDHGGCGSQRDFDMSA
jgi:hypothetical protein